MRYIYIQSSLLKSNSIPSFNITSLSRRLQSTASSENPLPIEDVEPAEESQTLIKKPIQRNKSRLLPQHRNMLLDIKPYNEPKSMFHLTEKYQRKMLGKYGIEESQVDPRICFYTKEQKQLQDEYERVAFPHTIQEMIKINEEQKQAKQLLIQKRENDILKKFAKLEQWKSELNAKIAKKEIEAREAKERKERLVEEVRRHFGFKVDPKDERFKELLEQKEKEDRKKQKEAKRKAKEDKMMAKLIETTSEQKQKAAKVDSAKDVAVEKPKEEKEDK